jgi:hypothetical protein
MARETSCTYLFARHWVPDQREVYQLLEAAQGIQIRKFSQPILRKNQSREVRDTRREICLNIGNAVLREEESS